jgi:iron complex outermembrane receptor protein
MLIFQELSIRSLSVLEQKLEGNNLKLERVKKSLMGGGVQSFPGLQPANALKESRSNVGIYTLDYDMTEAFLIGGSVRYENYSDFGDNISWKVNSRYKLTNDVAIRASFSTGFRAPALHQIYLSNIQTLVSGGKISNQGTFNNVDPAVIGLGVPRLHAEESHCNRNYI